MTEKLKNDQDDGTGYIKSREIGYAWNFAADLGNGRQFSLSGNFVKGISGQEMNEEVDKVRAVFDRQQAKSASRGASEEIDQVTLRRNSALEDIARIDEKTKDKGGATSAERQQREVAIAHIDKLNKDIEFKKKVLDQLLEESK